MTLPWYRRVISELRYAQRTSGMHPMAFGIGISVAAILPVYIVGRGLWEIGWWVWGMVTGGAG